MLLRAMPCWKPQKRRKVTALKVKMLTSHEVSTWILKMFQLRPKQSYHERKIAFYINAFNSFMGRFSIAPSGNVTIKWSCIDFPSLNCTTAMPPSRK